MLGSHRHAVALVVWFCAVLGGVPHAAAGPVEQLVQVAIHPSDPNVMLVRYIYGGDGMLRTRDGGKSWQLACDSMQFEPQTRSGKTVIAGDGSTWMGVLDGLWHDDAHGCGFARQAQYDGQWFGDLTNHPSDPGVMFAVTSTASPIGEHVLNGVLRRDASGVWSDFGAKEEMLATRLYVVEHDGGLRMYVSAVKGQITPDAGGMPRPNYVTRVSDDDGKTWQEFTLGVLDGTFRLEGVDPRNPDRVVATLNREPENAGDDDGDDSVLVSSDRGAHFVEYMKVSEFGGLAFAPDGRLWIGDLGAVTRSGASAGLWFAASLDEPAVRLPMANYPVQCLGYNRMTDTLFACQHFAFGVVDKDSGTFSSLIKLTEVTDFVECSGVDSTAACEMQLCGAYCGYAHFAGAPVCSGYDTPTCGVPVADAERRSLAGASTDGGTSAAGISLPTPAPVASDTGTGAASTGGDDAAHVDPPLMRAGKPGGCAATGVRQGGGATAALGLVLFAWLASRARRRSLR
jgi:uncharacterized protein (TIGR03382 family)